MVYVELSEVYQSVRIQTTIRNTMLPIFRVPFPSIGLCSRNRLNWKLLENGAVEHFLGANVSAAKKDLFIKFFTAAGDPHLARMNECKCVEKLRPPPFQHARLQISYANFALLQKIIQITCERQALLSERRSPCRDAFYPGVDINKTPFPLAKQVNSLGRLTAPSMVNLCSMGKWANGDIRRGKCWPINQAKWQMAVWAHGL